MILIYLELSTLRTHVDTTKKPQLKPQNPKTKTKKTTNKTKAMVEKSQAQEMERESTNERKGVKGKRNNLRACAQLVC